MFALPNRNKFILLAGFFFLFIPVTINAQYDELRLSLIDNFYFGQSNQPWNAVEDMGTEGYSVTYQSAFEAHDYDLIAFESNGTFLLNYWNSSWGQSINMNELTIIDYTRPIGASFIRQHFHPDSVCNQMINQKVGDIKSLLSKDFKVVSLNKVAFNAVSNIQFSETLDLDNNGIADIEITASFLDAGIDDRSFNREYYCNNIGNFLDYKNSYFLNNEGKYISRVGPQPNFPYFICTQQMNSSIRNMELSITVKVIVPANTGIDSVHVVCKNGRDFTDVYGTLTPLQKSSMALWKVNNTTLPKASITQLPGNKIIWSFPKEALLSGSNTIQGSFTKSTLEPVSIPLSITPDQRIAGCPVINSYKITAQCIQGTKISVTGEASNFFATTIYLNNSLEPAAFLIPTGTGTKFSAAFNFNSGINIYKITLKNNRGDSLVLPLLISEIYDNCKTVIDACNVPLLTPTKNRIDWITNNPKIVESRDFTLEAILFISEAPEITSIKLVKEGKDGFVEEDSIAGFKSFLHDDFKVNGYRYKEIVRLDLGINTFRLQYTMSNGAVLTSQPLTIKYNSYEVINMPKQTNKLHDLWVFSFGIDEYKSSEITDLHCAVNDAVSIDSLFNHLAVNTDSTAFRNIHTVRLLNENVTREHMIDTLQYYTTNHIAAGDYVIIYYSGHGKANLLTKKFYFITYDCTPQNYQTRGLSSENLNDVLVGAQFTYMLFIDACYSGSFTTEGSSKELSEEELAEQMENLNIASVSEQKAWMIFTAANSTQKAFEDLSRGHGYLAIALLMAFSNDPLVVDRKNEKINYYPDSDGNNILTISELNAFLMRSVKKLSTGRQQPWSKLFLPSDFPLVFVK